MFFFSFLGPFFLRFAAGLAVAEASVGVAIVFLFCSETHGGRAPAPPPPPPPPPSLLLRRFLLPGHCALAGTFPRAGVRVGALAADRQVPAMSHAAIAAGFHETLDVLGGLLTEIALDLVLVLDRLANPGHLVLG